jgi:ATP-dependent helicase HrpB
VIAQLEDWYPASADGGATLDPPPADVARAILGLAGHEAARRVGTLAPLSFPAPTGRPLIIDNLNDGGPTIEARVQEFFGASRHPAIGGGAVALCVSLLSPAGRQAALTKDLPAFWANGYRDMAKDMRGRYPKHDWPDDPAKARPHEGRTKKRL